MRQLTLKFKTNEKTLSTDYTRGILSYIKHAISEYSEELFEEWFKKGITVRKQYTFSCYFPGQRYLGDRMSISENNFSINLSVYDVDSFVKLYNALLMQRKQTFNMLGTEITLEDIRVQTLPRIECSTVLVKFDSPLIVRKHDKETNKEKYLGYEEEGFYETLNDNIEASAKAYGISSEGFKFEPVQARKVVIRHFRMKVNANIGIYRISGTPELLNYLFAAGIGSATNSGHGKFRIIRRGE